MALHMTSIIVPHYWKDAQSNFKNKNDSPKRLVDGNDTSDIGDTLEMLTSINERGTMMVAFGADKLMSLMDVGNMFEDTSLFLSDMLCTRRKNWETVKVKEKERRGSERREVEVRDKEEQSKRN